MKSRRLALPLITLTCMLAAPAFAQSMDDWVDIKDPNELRALYSNKTFRGKGWVGHYRADGTGIVKVQGAQHPRTWEVKGNDSVCATAGSAPAVCYRYQRNSKSPNKIAAINVLDDIRLEFTVEDGIPNF